MSTGTDSPQVTDTLVERMGLKTLVESCLVLEEGVASAKDIEVGMMMGAGILPGPFARADDQGLDEVLAALERAQSEWGDNYRSPTRASRARPSRSRPAATWASSGSTARPPTRCRRR
jgi:3-hydroxyacyl-CoA dehydrogenase